MIRQSVNDSTSFLSSHLATASLRHRVSRNIAAGLCFKFGIAEAGIHLVTRFGIATDVDNLSAICRWVDSNYIYLIQPLLTADLSIIEADFEALFHELY